MISTSRLVFCITVCISLSFSQENEEILYYNQSADNINKMENAYLKGYGLVTTGFIFLGGAVAMGPAIIAMGKTGNLGGTIGLGLVGGVCEIISPLMMSGGATGVQSAYERNFGTFTTGNNWSLYQAGLIFTLTSKLIGFLPFGKDTLFSDIEEGDDMTVTKVITYSPMALTFEYVGQFIYLLNGIHALFYIGKTKREIKSTQHAIEFEPYFGPHDALGVRIRGHLPDGYNRS